jgi:hypothetical protein
MNIFFTIAKFEKNEGFLLIFRTTIKFSGLIHHLIQIT